MMRFLCLFESRGGGVEAEVARIQPWLLLFL